MGKTRKRVTFLVLSLEALGFVFLGLALYLVGDSKLECRRDGERVFCEASARRLFGLLRFETRSYSSVIGVDREEPAIGRIEHWLVLETQDGRERVLPGSQSRTEADVERLQRLFDGREQDLAIGRSAAPLAFAAAVFGCLWIFIISLIMREFLDFHTPWWWRVLGRQ